MSFDELPVVAARFGLLALLLAMVLSSCGDFTFDAPILRIETLSLHLSGWEDTLDVEESVRLHVRVLNQEGLDVTAMTSSIDWRISPTTVAGLTTGDTRSSSDRLLQTFGTGEALLTVVASFQPVEEPEIIGSVQAALIVIEGAQ